MYVQRYMQHFPAAGEIVIFDRSWYNRAGVERVMGFCTDEQYDRFMKVTPGFEKQVIDGGVILIKLWLEVGNKEQERRFKARMDDPLRQWKLSNMDLPSRAKWYEYSRARDAMFKVTDTSFGRSTSLRAPSWQTAAPPPMPPRSVRVSVICRCSPSSATRRPRRV